MVYTVSGVQYTRRKKIPVTGAGSGAQTNYQIKLAAVWAAAMQADFDDVRFTKADMQTLIDAWLESKVDSTSAVIWAEFPTTPADGVEETEAYMYFGNASVASDWDGTATFQFFDDFENNNFNKWTSAGSAWSIQSTIKFDGTYAAQGTGHATAAQRWLSKNWTNASGFINVRYRPNVIGTVFYVQQPTDSSGVLFWVAAKGGHYQYHDGAWKNFPTDTTYTIGVWDQIEIGFDYGADKYHVWVNGAKITGAGLPIIGSGTQLSAFRSSTYNATSDRNYIDNYFVRKYASGPPTAAFGTEEHQRRTPMMM